MRKTGLFTHVRDNLRGDVSGKRFNAHVVERNLETNCEGGRGGESCVVGKQGKTRVRARAAPARVTAAGVSSQGNDTGNHHSGI